MDHGYVEEHGLVDSYLAGRLSESERDAFEAHYFACATCLELLETAEGFREGMLQAAAEDTVHVRAGLLAGLAALSLRHRLALAVALLVLALPGLWLAQRNRGLERQWAEASANSELQRAALEARLHGLQQAAAAERRQLAEELEQERQAHARSERTEPADAIQPQVNLAFFTLAAVRGGEAGREPVNQIPLSSSDRSVALALELATIDSTSYRASLKDAAGKEIWQARGLRPDSRDTLVLLLPARLVPPGVYELTIEGEKAGGGRFAAGAYPFRVVRRP